MKRPKLIGNILLIAGVVSLALSLLMSAEMKVVLSVTSAVLTVIGAVLVIRDHT